MCSSHLTILLQHQGGLHMFCSWIPLLILVRLVGPSTDPNTTRQVGNSRFQEKLTRVLVTI